MTTITVKTPTCTVCGRASFFELDSEEVARWQRGENIQVVWPDMPKEEREVLISGTHSACWDRLFAGTEF